MRISDWSSDVCSSDLSVGFGGKIASWTDKRGTEWRLSPILIGGYVKFPADNPDGPKEGEITLKSLPRWQRAIVVAAAPMINLLLAAFLLAVIDSSSALPPGQPSVTNGLPSTPPTTP